MICLEYIEIEIIFDGWDIIMIMNLVILIEVVWSSLFFKLDGRFISWCML